jgi:hypothetical protein
LNSNISGRQRGGAYKKSDIETAAHVEVKLLLQTHDSSVADVDAIQKGHHINDEEDGENGQVELSEELALGDWIESCMIRRRI